MSEQAFDDWLEASGEDAVRAEWADGEVIVMGNATVEHNDLVMWLAILIRLFVKRRKLGFASFDNTMRVEGQRRVPDAYFVAEARRGIIARSRVDGPVDLAVEVVSPDSVENDYVTKYREYQRAGVREYWIVDPQNRAFTAFGLNEAGDYRSMASDAGRFCSAVLPGFSFRPSDLWADPLPAEEDVLAEMDPA